MTTIAVPAPTVHVTTLSEAKVLTYTWCASHEPDVDRVQLLRQLSVVVIQRPPTWDTEAVRAVNPWEIPGVDAPDRCFCCRTGDRRLYWHHIITVAHGGSNDRRNLVAICYRCHRAIHPWMPQRTDAQERYSSGWSSTKQLVDEYFGGEPAHESAPPRRHMYGDDGDDGDDDAGE